MGMEREIAMNILLHYTHYPVSSGRYMTEAFRRLGHTAYHIGQETGRSIWGMEVPQEYVWCQDAPPDEWLPDLCILMDTAYQWHHETVPTIVYTVDNHVRNVRQDGIAHYFLGHKNVSIMPYTDDCTWLPCGYDPTLFTPSPIPYTEREYDVCMIGVMYPERWRLVNELKAAGLKVLAGTGLIYEAYRDAYHNSRISLCQSINGDVAQRVFETAAMGCVVMSDKCPDFDTLTPNGIWLIDKDVPFVEQVRGILADPVKAQEQIALSMEWAKPHTWDARAQVIIDWWEANHA
jgi:hypothetical protein